MTSAATTPLAVTLVSELTAKKRCSLRCSSLLLSCGHSLVLPLYSNATSLRFCLSVYLRRLESCTPMGSCSLSARGHVTDSEFPLRGVVPSNSRQSPHLCQFCVHWLRDAVLLVRGRVRLSNCFRVELLCRRCRVERREPPTAISRPLNFYYY